jgi:hypothetical protein
MSAQLTHSSTRSSGDSERMTPTSWVASDSSKSFRLALRRRKVFNLPACLRRLANQQPIQREETKMQCARRGVIKMHTGTALDEFGKIASLL